MAWYENFFDEWYLKYWIQPITHERTVREVDAIVRYLEVGPDSKVLDLCCGQGRHSLELARRGYKNVVGLDLSETLLEASQQKAREEGLEVDFIHGDIRTSLANVDQRPDIMIIDPPRSGMHKDVVKTVLDIAPNRIVYVSCNPATLARDLGMMKAVYRVAEVQPIDMFPHTFHIEAVARMEKREN